jgi:hypothetical protein
MFAKIIRAALLAGSVFLGMANVTGALAALTSNGITTNGLTVNGPAVDTVSFSLDATSIVSSTTASHVEE